MKSLQFGASFDSCPAVFTAQNSITRIPAPEAFISLFHSLSMGFCYQVNPWLSPPQLPVPKPRRSDMHRAAQDREQGVMESSWNALGWRDLEAPPPAVGRGISHCPRWLPGGQSQLHGHNSPVLSTTRCAESSRM